MSNFYKIIATNVKNMRAKLELSQENLAELVGLDRKTINAIESGNKSIKFDLFYTEKQASDNDKLILCVSLLNNLNNEKLDYALKFLNSIK